MGDKEELKVYLDERFDKLEEKLSKFIGRFITSVAIAVTIFLFIIGGSFAFTSRVNTDLQTTKDKVEGVADDLTDIDGALGKRFPDSSIFGERAKRERKNRGGEI